MEVTIREYRDEDRPAIEKLMQAYNAYFERIDPWHLLKYPENAVVYYVDRMITDSAKYGGKIFVAQNDEIIVGFIQGSMHVQTDVQIQERGHVISGDINELYVDESYQGQHVGKALIETMENYFWDKGCQQIALDVFAPNKKARKFYEKMGFSERALILVKRKPSH